MVDSPLPLRSPHLLNFEEGKFLEEQLSFQVGSFQPQAFKATGTQCLPGKSGSPGRTPVLALTLQCFPQKVPEQEKPLSPFRTTSPRSQPPRRSNSLCTVPVIGARTPLGWRKLGAKGALPLLRPASLGLSEAWVMPPVVVVMVRGTPPAPTVPTLCS